MPAAARMAETIQNIMFRSRCEEICHADRCEGAADGGDQDYGNAFERNADQADHESNEGDESITCDIVWIDEMPEAKADEPADQKKSPIR